MIEMEWEKAGTRADAAALLRHVADALAASGDEVEIEHDGWEVKLKVGDELEMGIEVEVEEDETELEIELKWSRGAPAASAGSGDAGE